MQLEAGGIRRAIALCGIGPTACPERLSSRRLIAPSRWEGSDYPALGTADQGSRRKASPWRKGRVRAPIAVKDAVSPLAVPGPVWPSLTARRTRAVGWPGAVDRGAGADASSPAAYELPGDGPRGAGHPRRSVFAPVARARSWQTTGVRPAAVRALHDFPAERHVPLPVVDTPMAVAFEVPAHPPTASEARTTEPISLPAHQAIRERGPDHAHSLAGKRTRVTGNRGELGADASRDWLARC
jgi:hypothetical protein